MMCLKLLMPAFEVTFMVRARAKSRSVKVGGSDGEGVASSCQTGQINVKSLRIGLVKDVSVLEYLQRLPRTGIGVPATKWTGKLTVADVPECRS